MSIYRIRCVPSLILCAVSLCVSGLIAADAPADSSPRANEVFDRTLTSTEKEFVSLVEAMPADKFNFAPTAGKFDGVRTFGQEATHAAFVLYEVSSAMLGEKNPSATSPHENGPENLKSKDQSRAKIRLCSM